MREWQSQSHVRWYCRYHVVWVPKYRKRAIFGEMRRGVGRIVRELCQRQRRGVGGRARAVGSRACLVGYSTEVECREHGGVLEREVGDSHSSGVSGAAAQLHGLPLLGARVLRQHRRFGGRGHPRLHPEAGSGREETGETGNLANRRPLRGAFLIPPPQGASCAPGFSWTLDCERVLAGGVSRWGSQIRNWRRRREPEGRPEGPPGAAVGAGFPLVGSGEVVLRLLRGEDLESVSRELGITAARASQWREQFLAAGQGRSEEPRAGCAGRSQSSAAGQGR